MDPSGIIFSTRSTTCCNVVDTLARMLVALTPSVQGLGASAPADRPASFSSWQAWQARIDSSHIRTKNACRNNRDEREIGKWWGRSSGDEPSFDIDP
jgi:hypothetical protein